MNFSGRKGLICSILAFSALMGILIFKFEPGLPGLDLFTASGKEHVKSECEAYKPLTENDWIDHDYEKFEIPQDVDEDAASIGVVEKKVSVDGVDIAYRTGSVDLDSVISVLILHGSNFNSKIWESIRTIQYCTAFGYRTIAVDLPGYGNSPEVSRPAKNNFLSSLIAALNLKRPVLVSPSMSGSYSAPFIVEHWKEISGFVPVSPVGGDLFFRSECGGSTQPVMTKDHYCTFWRKPLRKSAAPDISCIKVPTMVVCGEYDNKLNSGKMCQLPLSTGILIPKGNHPAYTSNPDMWHLVLYNFLQLVHRKEKCPPA